MPAYHSTFPADPVNDRTIGNFVLLPLNTKFRGPAYPSQSDYDIIDESLDLFRANSLFKNFEIKVATDRVLIYGILFISDCLSKLNARINAQEAVRVLTNLALDSFSVPGDAGFTLNSVYQAPGNKQEYDLLKSYLQQFRQELAMRLVERLYRDDQTTPNKHWLGFTKRRFMNKSL